LRDIPDTMLAARAYEGAAPDFRLEQIAVPTPGPGEVLVQVAASAMITGLITNWSRGAIKELPGTLSAEMAGRVAVVGDGVAHLAVGDRVRVHPNLSCRRCAFCLTDREMLCRSHSIIGHASFGPDELGLYRRYHNGGLAEYVLVPEWTLDPIPESVSYAVAAKVRDMGTTFRALQLAAIPAGGAIVVNAATGSQGVSAVRLAPFFGVARILAIGRSAARLEEVRALNPSIVETLALEDLPSGWEERDGVTDAVRRIIPGGPDAVLDFTPPQGGAVSWQTFKALRRGGTGVIVGGNSAMPSMSTVEFMYDCIHIVGSRNGTRRGGLQILELIATGQLPADDLITHSFPLSGVADAVDAVLNRPEKTWWVSVEVAALD
jgi:threonine dehydrogenase-like Zn-dependent dehydrogenase